MLDDCVAIRQEQEEAEADGEDDLHPQRALREAVWNNRDTDLVAWDAPQTRMPSIAFSNSAVAGDQRLHVR